MVKVGSPSFVQAAVDRMMLNIYTRFFPKASRLKAFSMHDDNVVTPVLQLG
jgi:hypothetical protein